MITLEYLRQFRIGGYAVFDLAVSFLGMYLLAPLLSMLISRIGITVPKRSWVYLTLPLGLAVHILVGTQTQMTKDFLDLQGHLAIKVIILGSLVLTARGIRLVRSLKRDV